MTYDSPAAAVPAGLPIPTVARLIHFLFAVVWQVVSQGNHLLFEIHLYKKDLW